LVVSLINGAREKGYYNGSCAFGKRSCCSRVVNYGSLIVTFFRENPQGQEKT